MSFAYSASEITQAGTDTSLNGLNGLTGVAVTDFGSSSGGFKLYVLSGVRLLVTGTLSFDPNIERLVFDTTCLDRAVDITGSFAINGTQTFYSTSVGFQYYAITFLKISSALDALGSSALVVRGAGTFNLIRAYIYTNAPLFFESSSTETVTDGGIVSSRVVSNDQLRIRSFSSALTIAGCFFSNISLDFFRPPLSLSRLTWRGSARAFEVVSSADGGVDSQIVFSGLSVLGTTYDISSWRRANIKLKNPLQGTVYRVTHDQDDPPGSATQITCDVSLRIKNSASNAVLTNGSLFVRDTNNSNRANANYLSGTVNFANDRTYYANANGSGVFPTQEILCYVIRGGTTSNLAAISYDYRGIENSASNVFNFIFAAYGFLPSVQAIAVFGTADGGSFAADVSVLPDARITQANPATVLGYSTQAASTFQNIYDFSALDKTLSTGIEFSTTTSRIFESTDGKSGFFNYGLIVNSALSGISVNHTTGVVSIKALSTSGTYNEVNFNAGKNVTLSQSGNFSAIAFVFALNTSVLNVSSGSTNVRSWVFPSGMTINNTSASAAVVTVDSATGITTTSTGGGSITLVTPVATLRLYGLPLVANAVLHVQDLTSLTITNPTVASGEAAVSVDPTRSYKIRADAPGYLASNYIILSGSIPEYQFNLINYRALYEAGTNRAAQLVFNPSTYVITVNDNLSSYTFADVFRTLEDYLATSVGLLFTAHPYPVILPDRNILWFPYDDVANTVNPVKIKPNPANTTDPTFTDFEFYKDQATDTVFDLFDFTSGGGRILRVRSQVAIATIPGGVTVSGFSPNAITASALDASAIAEIQAGLPDVAAFEARTLPATNYFDPAADTVTVSAISADVITANTLDSSAIAEIQSGLSTYNGGDTSGTSTLLSRLTSTRADKLDFLDVATSSRLSDSSYVAPNNAGISAIQNKTDLLAFTGGNVNAIANVVGDKTGYSLTVITPSASDNAAAVWGAATRTLTSGVNIALAKGTGVTGFNDITAENVWSVSDRQLTSFAFGTTIDNAAIAAAVRSNLGAELSRIDATVSSRAIASDLNVTVSGGFTGSDRIALLAIPTNPLLATSYTAPDNTAIANIATQIGELYARQGLLPGVSATVKDAAEGTPGFLTTTNGLEQSLTKNNDSSVTVTRVSAAATLLPWGVSPGEASVAFAYGDATPKLIFEIPTGKTVFVAQVIILIPFNGVAPSLRVGDSGDLSRLVAINQNNPLEVGTYTTNPGHTYTSATQVLLSIVAGSGCTQGSGIIFLEFN